MFISYTRVELLTNMPVQSKFNFHGRIHSLFRATPGKHNKKDEVTMSAGESNNNCSIYVEI